MTPSAPQLPILRGADFGPGLDHVAEAYLSGKVFATLHKDDPVRSVLPGLTFTPDDPYTYVFVHGGKEGVSRFENRETPTHEIPVPVVAQLLGNQFGGSLNGMLLRLCTCYGNLLRPGETRTVAQRLAGLLPQATVEAYHGLVILDAAPPRIRRGHAVYWDASGIVPGPVVAGPPGPWELIVP